MSNFPLAAYTKIVLTEEPKTEALEKFSAIQMKTDAFDIIFLYLSKDYEEQELFNLLEKWIGSQKPTSVIGDVNWDFSENSSMKKFMTNKGFRQLIKNPTFDKGTLIDHIYVNESMYSLTNFTQQDPAYYSDHDIVSLFIQKQ